jgi:hypothetical protein
VLNQPSPAAPAATTATAVPPAEVPTPQSSPTPDPPPRASVSAARKPAAAASRREPEAPAGATIAESVPLDTLPFTPLPAAPAPAPEPSTTPASEPSATTSTEVFETLSPQVSRRASPTVLEPLRRSNRSTRDRDEATLATLLLGWKDAFDHRDIDYLTALWPTMSSRVEQNFEQMFDGVGGAEWRWRDRPQPEVLGGRAEFEGVVEVTLEPLARARPRTETRRYRFRFGRTGPFWAITDVRLLATLSR